MPFVKMQVRLAVDELTLWINLSVLVVVCGYLFHLFIVSWKFSTFLCVAVLTVFEGITSQAD